MARLKRTRTVIKFHKDKKFCHQFSFRVSEPVQQVLKAVAGTRDVFRVICS